MDAFGWLGQIGEGVLKLAPRIVIVRKTWGGVVWWFGRYDRPLRPGIWVLWPLVADWELIQTAEQPLPLTPQRLNTSDGVPVLVCGWLSYSIDDAHLLLSTADTEWEPLLSDIMADVLAEVVQGAAFADLSDRKSTNTTLRNTARNRLRRYGVRALRCSLSDIVRADFVLANWPTE